MEMTERRAYGLQIEPSEYAPKRDLVCSPEETPGGNVVLAVGRETGGGHWEKIAHVVLTPSEWAEFRSYRPEGVVDAAEASDAATPEEAARERLPAGTVVRHADSPDDLDQRAIVVRHNENGSVDLVGPGPEGVGVESVLDVRLLGDLVLSEGPARRDVEIRFEEIGEEEVVLTVRLPLADDETPEEARGRVERSLRRHYTSEAEVLLETS